MTLDHFRRIVAKIGLTGMLSVGFVFLTGIDGCAQSAFGIPFKKQEAFILQYDSPFQFASVEMGSNSISTSESINVTIPETAKIADRKGRPIDRSLLRPGMMVEIDGTRMTDTIVVDRLQLKIDHEKWDIEVNGYFEGFDGTFAWIDGQRVIWSAGLTARGKNEWKTRAFSSFNEMPLGAEVKVKGNRRADGLVHAVSVEVIPNLFTKGDARMFQLASMGRLLPANLSGGKGKVAGVEVKFVESLELQTYVTKIGNRLIPRYQKDMPDDYPGKITYRFAVIENDSFNAFALPDGAIFVNTGMLKALKNEAQLASVLGHEIAHVTHEHSRRESEDPKKMWLPLAGVLGGAVLGGQTGAQIGAMAANALNNHYSRMLEDQADRVGLQYMVAAGYDPREAPKVWRIVAQSTKSDAVANFLYSGHSAPMNRLKHLNRAIAFNHYDSFNAGLVSGEIEYLDAVGAYFGWRKPAATISPSLQNPLPVSAKPVAPKSMQKPRTVSGKPVRKRP